MDDRDTTQGLLERFHGGDRAALSPLLERHLPWLRKRIRLGLNPELRRLGGTEDYLDQLVLQVLERSPRFVVSKDEHFRRLLAVMVRHVLTDGGRHLAAAKRERKRERLLPTTMLYLDGDGPSGGREPRRPDAQAMEDEERELARLTIELLFPEERRIIELHEEDGLSFAEIGKLEGLSDEGARKRFQNGIRRAASILAWLKRRDLDRAIRMAESEEVSSA